MQVYYCYTTEFANLDGKQLLSEKRKAEIDRLKCKEDKIRSLVAGLLIRYVFGEGEKKVEFSQHGKPYIKDRQKFNLSHSNDMVIIAVDTEEIGVDVEFVKDIKNGAIKRCFTTEEQSWLEENYSSINFYKLWTGKESVMKATGLGFLQKPKTFSVLPISNGAHQINDKKYYLNWKEIGDYTLCICSNNPVNCAPINLTKINLLK